ncbi:MAG: type I-E CRISPR-associated protein Cas5/CasD [Candidatus Riflebacteria bacterium]|nr:type I-E CRISPR-associated protein Cas5/CasD [Candidatus Riflebacteria bacterium]
MKEFLALRFDAPMMSFGGPIVDNFGVIQDFPALSMMTGLLANALGFGHADVDHLENLQRRLRYAVRRDRQGEKATDFQTVDLGQEFLQGTGWTTRGAPEGRDGASSDRTHIRYREFRFDAVFTVVLTLVPPGGQPDLAAVEEALRQPSRPLFLGRKPCLPAAPLLFGRYSAESLVAALAMVPPVPASRRDEPAEGGSLPAWWPAEDGGPADESVLIEVSDERDWANQIHVSRRLVRRGRVTVREVPE